MANEAVIIELLGVQKGCPIRYGCADGAGIVKGTILKMTDDRKAEASGADNDPFAGIVAEEKVASDGAEFITAYTFGIFDLKLTAVEVTAGDRVSIGGASNVVSACAVADNLFSNVGIALSTGNAVAVPVLVGSGL